MTSEQFLDGIYHQVGWRIKETAALRATVHASSGDAQWTAMRAGVALLYAHWEGTVKSSAREYLAFVSHQGLTYDHLATHLVATKLAHMLGDATRKPSYYRDAAELLMLRRTDRVSISENVVRTEGNLTFDRFLDIVFCLGIDPTPFEPRKNFIDVVLVEKRNKVVHGDRFIMTLSDYEELHNGVQLLIRTFLRSMVDIVVADACRR